MDVRVTSEQKISLNMGWRGLYLVGWTYLAIWYHTYYTQYNTYMHLYVI